MIGGALTRYRDPATARQILLDAGLPDDAFVKVATQMMEAADPVGREAGLKWVKAMPESPRREELLAVGHAVAGPRPAPAQR